MNASSRLTALTRIGFATRGLLYIVIAMLIVRTAGRRIKAARSNISAEAAARYCWRSSPSG